MERAILSRVVIGAPGENTSAFFNINIPKKQPTTANRNAIPLERIVFQSLVYVLLMLFQLHIWQILESNLRRPFWHNYKKMPKFLMFLANL